MYVCACSGVKVDKQSNIILLITQGRTGSNISTVTCVDTLTMQRAEKIPQRFDLIRNRMGGWSNFFCAMPQAHQKQHVRRPMYGPHAEKKEQD